MMTIAEGLERLIEFKNGFKSKLEDKGMTVLNDKLDSMLGLIDDMGNTNYVYADIVTTKTNTLSFGTFDFLPENFAIASLYALENQYTFAQSPFEVIGSMSLNEIETGENEFTVEILGVNEDVTEIDVTVDCSLDEGEYTLSLTLPEGYYFLGEYEWAVLGGRNEMEEE